MSQNMSYKLYINLATYTENHSSFPKPEANHYDYWIPLIGFFIDKSDRIEIHCWNSEMEIIQEMKLFHGETLEMVVEENLTIFYGNITSTIRDYLLYSYISKNGRFKWFTVRFKDGLFPVLSSEHWGTEFFVPSVTEKEIEYIKSITPKGTIYHTYQ